MKDLNIKEAKKFLNIANGDLKAAQYLHKKELYPQAISLFQQSVEKSAKSIMFALNLVNYKDIITEISHNSLKILEVMRDRKKESIESLDKLHKNFPKLANISLIKKVAFGYSVLNQNKFKELLGISSKIDQSEEEIENIIDSINKYYLEILEINKQGKNSLFYQKITSKADEELEYMLNELLEVVAENYPSLVLDLKKRIKKSDIRKIKNMIHELTVPFFTTSIFLFLSTFILSLLTQSHSIRTRYPDKNFDPLKHYNSNLPIVAKFKELSRIEEYMLNTLSYWLQQLDEIPSDYLLELICLLGKKN